MNLTNLTKGQKLYSALNGEVTFVCYINNRDKVPYLICTEKNDHLFYYLINGKVDNEGMIILFINAPSKINDVELTTTTDEEDTIVKVIEGITKSQVVDVINVYESVVACPFIDCTNKEQVIEEVWKRVQ